MYKCCNFLFHSSADGHLGCFHVLTVDPLFFKKIKSASSFPHPFAFPPLSVSMSSLTHFSFPSVSAEQESLVLIKMNPSIETLDSIPFGDCNLPPLSLHLQMLLLCGFIPSWCLFSWKHPCFGSPPITFTSELFLKGAFYYPKETTGVGEEKQEHLCTVDGNVSLGQSPCKTVWKFLKKLKILNFNWK